MAPRSRCSTGEHLHVPTQGEPTDLELRHYGSAPGTFELYDDDGTTFGYERGAFSWTPLTVARAAGGALAGAEVRRPVGKPFSYRRLTWKMMTPQ